MMEHEGPARVFDCEEDAIDAIKGGKIVVPRLPRAQWQASEALYW